MPSLIYKYFGKHGVEVVENFELKVAPPNEFNDLFEVTPRPSAKPLSQQEFDTIMDSQRGKNWFNEMLKSEEFRRNYARLGGSREKFYEFAVPKMPIRAEEISDAT